MDSRIEVLNDTDPKHNTLYIMRRDQRIFENYCIEYGYTISYKLKSKLYINLPFNSLKCNKIQESFYKEGIKELMKECKNYNLYFHMQEDIKSYIEEYNIGNIILDFSPLRESIQYRDDITELCKSLNLFCVEIDSHNVVPHKLLSVYKRTGKSVKSNLYKHFNTYLKEFENFKPHEYNDAPEPVADLSFEPYKYFKGGYSAGMLALEDFFKNRFSIYAEYRNNPDVHAISDLSPYLHSGQISSQKVILLAYEKFYKVDNNNLDIFCNEVFVWKETAEHFCYHEPNYDNIMGALEWARNSLMEHKNDKRDKIYSFEDLENAKTSEPLWNAGQNELVHYGKMHGYVRMYWAKQLLKWTSTPEEALDIALSLNDKYSIDGNDPNGYAGIMWSICGSMDQGWKERDITGKIRPMNPFKCKKYIDRWNNKQERKKFLKGKEIKREDEQ